MVKRVLFFAALLVSGICHAQDITGALSAYFGEVRSGKYPAIPKQLSITENSKATLAALTPFLTDTTVVVRGKAYAIAQLAGTNARQAHLRQDAVQKLMQGARDTNAGNAGLALGYLPEFLREDFTPSAQDSLVALLKRRAVHLDKIARLVGYLEIATVRNDLRAIAQESSASKKDRWSAMLALARMGDGYALENIMSRLRRLPVNDDVVYEVFPDVVYTRNKALIDYLVTVLNSTDANCNSADAEHPARIPCGYRVMEMLAPAVEGYPLKVDASGDIDAKDYVAALQSVRDWFKANPAYKVNKNKY
jgi:hypothetical protein